MRFILKECQWETIGDELVIVKDPREAVTLSNTEGHLGVLLQQMQSSAKTADELLDFLQKRDPDITGEDLASFA